ncbi:cobalt ECF transporter T component CbiQ [Halococcus sp. PRR34]|uniref:cobalt ECF transporter T component CbiQ n=1 Tax=Halococcus sp. PRR34 TaxID=3020830 RepID=UPI00235F5680|nr:cobalt ECF transporter T component CbiQ [Halococcus sp. PRR34]
MTGELANSTETVSSALRDFFAAERIEAEDGFLQTRDPRVAVLSVAGLALAVMLTRTLPVVVSLGGVAVVLAWRSSVPLRRLLARSLVVPLTSAVIVLPQAVLLPGETLVGVAGFAVTDAGVAYVLLFTLRVGVGVGLLSLLVLTTPFSVVVAAMRDLRVPVAIVWVTAITYRYLFVFFDELRRLILARNSRTAGEASVHRGWRDARGIAGTFLLRTLDRGERVGRGMRARGGARPPSPYGRSRALEGGDYVLLAVALLAIAGSGVVRWIA